MSQRGSAERSIEPSTAVDGADLSDVARVGVTHRFIRWRAGGVLVLYRPEVAARRADDAVVIAAGVNDGQYVISRGKRMVELVSTTLSVPSL